MVKSLAFLSAKAAKVPAGVSEIYTAKSVVNVPLNYLNYKSKKTRDAANKKFMHFVAKQPPVYNFRGTFNRTTPGVYKNKNWRYYSYNQNGKAIFANVKQGPYFSINHVTGNRKNVKARHGKNIGKRSKYNTWNKFVKRGTRSLGMSKVNRDRAKLAHIIKNMNKNVFYKPQIPPRTKLRVYNNSGRITHVITAHPNRRVISVGFVNPGQRINNVKNSMTVGMNSSMKKLKYIWDMYARTGWVN